MVQSLPDQPKLCANWIMGELIGKLNKENSEILNCSIKPEQLSRLLQRIIDGTISGKAAKIVFESMWQGEHAGDVDRIIAAKGLIQVSNQSEIEKLIDAVLEANLQQVNDYKNGKEKAFNSLVGQVMKASKGKANPMQVNTILREKLKG